MLRIELAPEEADELRFILESYLSDLRAEIRETDSRDFRATLKSREAFLHKLLEQLAGTETGSQPAAP